MARKKPLTPDSIGLDFDGWQVEPWPQLDFQWDFQWEDLVIDWPGIDWGNWEAVDWPDLRFDFWTSSETKKPVKQKKTGKQKRTHGKREKR